MKVVISPAKTLDFGKINETLPMTEPEFLVEAKQLVLQLKELDTFSLEKIMKISSKLSKLTYERFQTWSCSLDSARQCITAFKGEVYRGMDVGSYTEEDFFYANENLRILSGLYGVLKPFDGINQYRLEMGTKIAFSGYKNLYDFWGNKLFDNIAQDITKSNNNILINLASYEYFKAVEHIDESYNIKVITPAFKEYRNGEYKIVSMMAKRARGLMASFIIKDKIRDVEDLKKFNYEGYEYNKELSNDKKLIFTREKSYSDL